MYLSYVSLSVPMMGTLAFLDFQVCWVTDLPSLFVLLGEEMKLRSSEFAIGLLEIQLLFSSNLILFLNKYSPPVLS